MGIQSDERGEIWLQNSEGWIASVAGGKPLTPPSGNAPGLIGLTATAPGPLWVSSAGRVSLLKNPQFEAINFDGTVTYVQGVAASRRGGMWVGNDGKLRRWQGTNWVEDLGDAPWGMSALTAMTETRDGLVAAATDQGLFLAGRNTAPIHFSRTNVFPSDWVRCLCEDREGNLWAGAGSSGLTMVREIKGGTANPTDNWQRQSVATVSSGGGGRLWVGTEGGGVYRLQAGEWKHFGESEGLQNQYVWTVSEDAQGRLWAGTYGGGLFISDSTRFERVPGTQEITSPTLALLHRRDGSTWIGTGAGLVLYESGKLTWFGRNRDLERPDVRTILEDGRGRVWFGMAGGGLGRLEKNEVRQYRKSDGLSSDDVWSLYLDGDNALWIGTSGGGLNRFKNGKFSVVGMAQGLPDNDICHISDDGQGYLWMSSRNGVIRGSKVELNRCADGEIKSVHFLTYGTQDGLPGEQCSGGSQPTGCRTSDGRLWFATSSGLAVMNPNDVRTNELAPPVLIEELRVDGKPVKSVANGKLLIPPGHSRLDFSFTGLSFAVPEKVRFKHRLEPLEMEWRNAEDQTRKVSGNYVPPGDYTFRVIACNNDGVWNEVGASLAFTVLPHFWQTWWFRASMAVWIVAAVSGGVWFVARRRLHLRLEKAERQRAVERERTRIAKDIHDDLGASLTRITMLSQTARRELNSPGQAAVDIDRIFTTARELTRALDEIVWAVNPQHDTLDSLASYLGRFAEDFLRVAGIRCRLDVPLRLPHWPLTAEVRHNLFLAFKEALNNTVKHAGATEARITLTLTNDGFIVSLADNGCGLRGKNGNGDPLQRRERGNGLTNMDRRLTEIGGRFEIESEPGKGTKVIFVMKGTPITTRTE
jgi:signal transduction histidine kinase/ligand-binding sensor domain-containing protein